MTMIVRDLETIMLALQTDQMARHPYLRDYNSYSVLSTLNEAQAIQIQYVEDLAKLEIESNSVWTATGDALDTLVTDRGITRQEGNRAIGEITFRCTTPATSVITIPIGTITSATDSNGVKLYFETTEVGTIAIGFTSTAVDAQSVETGLDSNVPAYSINNITIYIAGISRVENVAPFSGGTEEESDDDLRDRYIYATDINGRATLPLIEQHIYDLDSVRECQVYQASVGEIEIIADSDTLTVTDVDVVSAIEENIAAGIVSRGKLLASINSGVITSSISLIEAGKIFIRVESALVIPNESFTLNYTNTGGLSRIASVIIPINSVDGDIILATMQVSSDFATEITGGTYTGANNYSVLGGLGTYPYLYLLPRKVLANAQITIKQTVSPDPNLETKVEDSITAFLDSFLIGDDLEFSDLAEYIYKDYATGEHFEGIDQITSVTVTANGLSINGFGQSITILNDQRVDPGSITVTLI